MKRFLLALCCLAAATPTSSAQNQAPTISGLQVTANEGSGELSVSYTLYDAEGDDVWVEMQVSTNGGAVYSIDVTDAVGDVGYPVAPDGPKQITWNYASAGIPDIGQARVRIIADDLNPVDMQQLVNQVDSNRLITDLNNFQGIRNYMVDEDNMEEVKNTLQNRFEEYGIPTYRQAFPYGTRTAHNIVGTLKGLGNGQEVYIIDAHFDTVENSPGADDNGSGVVAVLEAARILSAYGFDKSIKLIAFDLEEPGLLGSINYVANGIPPTDSIQGVLNFEMIGYYSEVPNSQEAPIGFELLFPDLYNQLEANQFRGDFITSIANATSNPLMQKYELCATSYVPDLKVYSIGFAIPDNLIPFDFKRSDHTPFWNNGYQALMITDGSNFRTPHYHQPTDLAEHLNFTFMGNVLKAAIATVADLAGIRNASQVSAQVDGGTGMSSPAWQCDWSLSAGDGATYAQVLLHGCDLGQNASLALYTISGELLYQTTVQPGTNQVQIPLNGAKGLCIVALGDGITTSGKKLLLR